MDSSSMEVSMTVLSYAFALMTRIMNSIYAPMSALLFITELQHAVVSNLLHA